MQKKYLLIRIVICALLVISTTIFYKVREIEKVNLEIETKMNKYLQLKNEVDIYSNLLENSNIVEKDMKELKEEKNKIDKEVSNLTLEINDLKEKIKKLN